MNLPLQKLCFGCKLKIFISGPMTDIKEHNYSEFDRVERFLRGIGYEVVNPANFNREYDHGDIEGWDWLSTHPEDLRECFEREWAAVRECDAIFLLNNWQNSRGARAELSEALLHGKTIYLQSEEKI